MEIVHRHAMCEAFRAGRSAGKLIFFPDEKNFFQDRIHIRQNDCYITGDPQKVPIVIKTKFMVSVMILKDISSLGDVMGPRFFTDGLRVRANEYLEVRATQAWL